MRNTDENELKLGRGEVYFNVFAPGTDVGRGERYLGSTQAFSLNVETQQQNHYSMERGIRTKDESVTTQIDFMGNITADNIDHHNISLFFMGSRSTQAVAAATGATETFTNVLPGTYLQLGATATNPTGLRSTTIDSVTRDPLGTPAVATANTDYVVDNALGRIYIVPGGAITAGSTIEVTYDVAAHSFDTVVSGNDVLFGAMRFVAYNAVGAQTDYFMPKISLRPNGEFALKGEDWQQFGFQIEVLKLGSLEQIYANGRPYTV